MTRLIISALIYASSPAAVPPPLLLNLPAAPPRCRLRPLALPPDLCRELCLAMARLLRVGGEPPGAGDTEPASDPEIFKALFREDSADDQDEREATDGFADSSGLHPAGRGGSLHVTAAEGL